MCCHKSGDGLCPLLTDLSIRSQGPGADLTPKSQQGKKQVGSHPCGAISDFFFSFPTLCLSVFVIFISLCVYFAQMSHVKGHPRRPPEKRPPDLPWSPLGNRNGREIHLPQTPFGVIAFPSRMLPS